MAARTTRSQDAADEVDEALDWLGDAGLELIETRPRSLMIRVSVRGAGLPAGLLRRLAGQEHFASVEAEHDRFGDRLCLTWSRIAGAGGAS